jgi:hypothetical protein
VPTTSTSDRLAAAGDSRLTELGFRPDDREDLLRTIQRVLADPQRLADVDRIADSLRARIGKFELDWQDDPFALEDVDKDALDREWGIGVLPMLALVATADDVAAYHASRGIAPALSWVSLSDLGQQAWVNRRTFGAFGLHTYDWMRVAWSGALYWLGRLQFNLTEYEGDWVISTHIPESGPMTPELVADSFGRARAFFARHFPEYPTHLFHCHSWLLDPQLTEVLPAESNMVRFQQLWQLREDKNPGDGDAIFFVFRRRGDVDPASLPQTTTLERAIVAKLLAGDHWYVRNGVIEQDRFPAVEDESDRAVPETGDGVAAGLADR